MSQNQDLQPQEIEARQAMMQRLEAEELTIRTQMQRQQEEHQARLEMQKRLYEEEQTIRTQRQFQAPPMNQPVIINNVINNNVQSGRQSLGFLIRTIYFLSVGWWFGFVWLFGAILCFGSIIGIPLGVLMLAKAGDAFFLW